MGTNLKSWLPNASVPPLKGAASLLTKEYQNYLYQIAQQVDSIVPGEAGVSSVNVSGGTTGLTASGGPVTDTGTITLGGIVNTSHGGTGLDVIGTPNQVLSVNPSGTGLVYATPSAGGATTYAQIVGADGMTYFPMNDTSGSTMAAAIGSSGTYVGSPSLGQASMMFNGSGSSVQFNGVSQVATFNPGLTSYTGAWYIDGIVQVANLLQQGVVFHMYVNGNIYALGISDNSFGGPGNTLVQLQNGIGINPTVVQVGLGPRLLGFGVAAAGDVCVITMDGKVVHEFTTGNSPQAFINCGIGGVAAGGAPLAANIQNVAMTTFQPATASSVLGPINFANIAYRRYLNFKAGI